MAQHCRSPRTLTHVHEQSLPTRTYSVLWCNAGHACTVLETHEHERVESGWPVVLSGQGVHFRCARVLVTAASGACRSGGPAGARVRGHRGAAAVGDAAVLWPADDLGTLPGPHRPGVPVLPAVRGAAGLWVLPEARRPSMKPGGHGAIWKLMHDNGVFDWLAAEGALVTATARWANVWDLGRPGECAGTRCMCMLMYAAHACAPWVRRSWLVSAVQHMHAHMHVRGRSCASTRLSRRAEVPCSHTGLCRGSFHTVHVGSRSIHAGLLQAIEVNATAGNQWMDACRQQIPIRQGWECMTTRSWAGVRRNYR